jgi:hypothetical protein
MNRRLATLPADTWPPRMNADVAAAYVGERHVQDFLERVGKAYPQPRWTESQRRRFWYRLDLDKALGIAADQPTGLGAKFAANWAKRDG